MWVKKEKQVFGFFCSWKCTTTKNNFISLSLFISNSPLLYLLFSLSVLTTTSSPFQKILWIIFFPCCFAFCSTAKQICTVLSDDLMVSMIPRCWNLVKSHRSSSVIFFLLTFEWTVKFNLNYGFGSKPWIFRIFFRPDENSIDEHSNRNKFQFVSMGIEWV